MRKKARVAANQLFVKHPGLGRLGYNLLRWTRLSRSSRGVTDFLGKLKQRGFYPTSILDIGANSGEWSTLAHTVFPDGVFLLIEPQHEMAPFLNHFCAGVANAQWIEAGAGAMDGELTLTLWDDFQGSSFVPERSPELVATGKQRVVPIVTVDRLIEEGRISIPDLIKIDVQGFELEVLQGCKLCFGHTDLFLLETSFIVPQNHPDFFAIVKFMHDHKYVIYDIPGLKHRPFDGALAQADVCFARVDSPLRSQKRWD